MEKRTTSTLEIIHNWRHRSFLLLLLTCITLSVSAQKLPDVRVEQAVVAEESLFIEANRERILGNFDVAEAKLKALIKNYGKKAVYFYELAQVYENIGELAKAQETNLDALKLEPDNEWYWQYQASVSVALEDNEEAIRAFSRLSELFPERNYYLENIAFHHLRNDDVKSALSTLILLENRIGVNYETTRQKHLIYDEMGNKEAAAKELDAYLKNYPKDIRVAHTAAAYALQQDDKKRAEEYYNAILKFDDEDPIARGALLKLNRKGSTKYDQLTAFIEDRNINLDDKIVQMIPVLMDYQSAQSDFSIDQLQSMASSLITQYGESDKTLALLGDIYSVQNMLPDAATQYIKSIEFNDGNYLVWEQLLYVLADIKDADRLSKYAEEAMDLYPNKSLPPAFYGLSYALKNKMSQADKYLTQAKMVSGNNTELKQEVESIERLIDQLRDQ